MKAFIVLSALCAVSMAAPGYVGPLVSHSYHLGVPLGHDGSVLDTPEVAHAKAVHLATHAYEAARNTHGYSYVPVQAHVYGPAIAYGAPIGHDGRVVDTPEVAHAKAAHLTAHAQEAAKVSGLSPYGALAYASSPVYAYGSDYAAPLSADGRVVDTPEVAHAKAAHFAAHAQELANIAGKH